MERSWDEFEIRVREFCDRWFNSVRPTLKGSKYIDVRKVFKDTQYGFDDKFSESIENTCNDSVKEKFCIENLGANRFKYMGRVRKFRKYNNFFRNGQLITQSRVVDLTNRNIKDVINEERGWTFGYHSDLPLPVNSVSKIIGTYSGKALHNRYNPSYNPAYDIKGILTSNSTRFAKYMDNKDAMVLPGSWRFSMVNLVKMASEPKAKYSVEDLIAGLKSRVGIDLILPRVGTYNPNSIIGLRINPKANSGLWTGEKVGRLRRTSTQFTKYAALLHAKRVMTSDVPILDRSLIKLGGREKRNVFALNETKAAKARLTFGQEDIPTLIGQSIAKQFNESMQILGKGFNWGGRINGRQKFLDLVDGLTCDKTKGEINVNTDFSGHDNDVCEESIVMAFAVIYACFDECDKLRNLFYYVMSGMIFKRVVLPESNLIYEISKGVMSGHAFTSIVTTLCAYMTISTAINKVAQPEQISRTYLQGAGDDWIMKLNVGIRNLVHRNIEKYSSNSCTNFGKASGYLENDSLYDYIPTFLKKQYIGGLIGWNEAELYTNLSYPTSTKMTLRTRIMDYMIHCVSGPFNERIVECVKKLIIYSIIDKYTMQRLDTGTMRDYYANIYDKVYADLNSTLSARDVLSRTPMTIEHYIVSNFRNDNVLYLRDIICAYLDELDDRVHKSQIWMMRPTHFVRHEAVHRLKVFDINKTFIRYNIMFNRWNDVSKIYKLTKYLVDFMP